MKASISESENPLPNYEYKIANGVVKMEHYGIHLARKVGFPEEILEQAMVISKKLEQTWEHLRKDNPVYKKMKMNEMYSKAAYRLVQIMENNVLGEEALRNHLKEVQKEFRATFGVKPVQ
jgi:DNA mismatch repair protein MSH4